MLCSLALSRIVLRAGSLLNAKQGMEIFALLSKSSVI
jgi:hypothetical protein